MLAGGHAGGHAGGLGWWGCGCEGRVGGCILKAWENIREGRSEVASEQRPKGAEKCTLWVSGRNSQAEGTVCAKAQGQDPGCWRNSQGARVAEAEWVRGREGGGKCREGPEQVVQGLGGFREDLGWRPWRGGRQRRAGPRLKCSLAPSGGR